MTKTQLRALIGDPKKVHQELKAFRDSAGVFSSSRAHLIAQYPKKWVAVMGKDVVAHATTLPALLKKLQKLDIPKDKVMVRFIEKKLRTFIL